MFRNVIISDWKEYYSRNIWHVRIEPDNDNGLLKTSAIDALQIRGIDIQRFVRKLGYAKDFVMEEITTAIATVI